MQNNKKFSIERAAFGGVLFLVFYWIVVILFGSTLPANSGLAGVFAATYFAIILAVLLPAVIALVLFLNFLGRLLLPKQTNRKSTPQALSENKDDKNVSSLKMALLITLFPLFFILLIMLVDLLFSFGNGFRGTANLKPTGEYHYIVPGNPTNIRSY